MTEPIIRDERLGRFKSAQRLVDSIRELDRQIRLTEESGMTVDQAVMVMSVLDCAEPDIQTVIASVITKLSGNVPDKDPTPDPKTPDTPEPDPEPETPDEPESNEETLDETPVESEDSETAEAVDESPAPDTPEPETPEETEDASEISTSDDSRTITVDGCIHPVTVTKDGEVFINDEKQEVLYNTQGYAFLKLPGEKRLVRAVLHSLVMQAFRPTKVRKHVVHKNGNQRDCRLENLAYRDEIKVDRLNFDASDALEASLALVETRFNVGEAVKLLGERKKRASYDLVRKVMNKEIFTEVSDRYFDARLHVVQDVPKKESAEDTTETETTTETTAETTTEDATEETETTTTETVEEIKDRLDKRKALIKDALARCNNDLRKAYNLLRKEGHDEITIFMVFNVKNHEFGLGHCSDDDIVELIRYAKKMGLDIRYTLLKECDLDVVPERMFKKATRR